MRLKKKAILDSIDWSEMHPEILEIIAKKHNLYHEDYMSFAGVCKSWRSAAVRAANKDHYPNGLPSRFPSLFLVDKKEDNVQKKNFCLQTPSLFNAKKKEDDHQELFCIRKIMLPEASRKLCMPSGGWLLTFGDDYVPKLIYHFSREIINLNLPYTFSEFGISTLQWCIFFRKLVVVKSSLVVMLCGRLGTLASCRSGDEKWTTVLNGLEDITHHKGRIYSFGYDHRIKACDVYEGNRTIMETVSTLPKYLYGRWFEEFVYRAYC
ncbi:uncharacterized protein [Rutidosis leptorrhynchoides]|uniref:uncharacterized protein n=1 Tax=Rutidosis leptorrhynchoides TaxID=125765 RepID=UPI003A993648